MSGGTNVRNTCRKLQTLRKRLRYDKQCYEGIGKINIIVFLREPFKE